jgi:hypothetical protein
MLWVYEHHDSVDPERPICRSHPVSKMIKEHEDELKSAISSGDYVALDKAIKTCENVDIDVKMWHLAVIMHTKLKH